MDYLAFNRCHHSAEAWQKHHKSLQIIHYLLNQLIMITLSLESELQVVRLKMYLERNPQEATELAIQHYEDFLALAAKYKKLQSKLEDIEACMLSFSESYEF